METPVKFNKSFEALYNSAMALADQCIVKKEMPNRYKKLEEEYQELMDAYTMLQAFEVTRQEFFDGKNKQDFLNHVKGECGDLLFVLLHIAHLSGWTAFDLLHGAMSKMLARMNDANYVAKN